MDLTPFGNDGNEQKIAGLQNNLKMLKRQMYQKDHRMRNLRKELQNKNYFRAKAEKGRGKDENEMRSLRKRWIVSKQQNQECLQWQKIH